MIEIVLGVWVLCFILSLLLVLWNYLSTLQKLKSKSLINVNLNLKKLDLYWSVTNENFEKLEPDSVEKDKIRALRSNVFLGLLGLASILGFLLLVAIVFSLRFIIKDKRTMAVFKSELAKNPDLDKIEVEKFYQEFIQIC